MMQVPDHLSVTGVDLMSIDPINSLMSRFESARGAILEKMSVPDHITVNGEAKTIIADHGLYNAPTARMEVPSHLNVFHLTEGTLNNNATKEKSLPDSLAASNLENPYEEAKLMRKRLGVLINRVHNLESQLDAQKRKERFLLMTLIGAAITMAYTYLKRG